MENNYGFSPTFNSKMQHYSSHKPGHFRFMDMSSKHRSITDIMNDVEGKHNLSFSARRVLINLETHYNNNEFKKVHELLKQIQSLPEDSRSVSFFPKKDKELIIEIHNNTMRLRWIIRKMIYIWRNKKLYTKSSNIHTIDLIPIEELKKENTLYVFYIERQMFYTFHYRNLMNSIRMSLENQEYSFPNPKMPCNPYTNGPFTFKQLISIFDNFRQILYTKKQCIPKTLYLFSLTFNIKKFLEEHHLYLCLKASETYITDMADSEFNYALQQFLNKYYSLSVCFYCIKNSLKDYRSIFTSVLIEHKKYTNKLIKCPKDIKMTDIIIKKYDLLVDISGKKHYKRHCCILNIFTPSQGDSFSDYAIYLQSRDRLERSSYIGPHNEDTHDSSLEDTIWNTMTEENNEEEDDAVEFNTNTYWSSTYVPTNVELDIFNTLQTTNTTIATREQYISPSREDLNETT